jgi:hypothetical protein
MLNQKIQNKISAREVFLRITKQTDPADITAAVDLALEVQFDLARQYQEKHGRRFELTFPQFVSLVTKSRRQKMEAKMRSGNFERFMKSNAGYCLTWKSRAALKTGIMSVETACYLNREDSERACQFGPGDTHTAESIDLIRKARTGKKHTDATKAKQSARKMGHAVDDEQRAKTSAALKGKPKSAEQIARMKGSAAARWERVRAEKAALSDAQA